MRLSTLLFPQARQVRVQDVLQLDQGLVIFATTRGAARCPRCRRRSTRLHSHYERQLSDVACGGRAVTIALRVRRMRCGNERCPCRIFGERLPHLVAHRARRTVRAQAELLQQALALGGRPGVRAAMRLGLRASVRTLLRLLRRQPLPAVAPVRVLGVDDFAFRRGRRYGTIVIDVERRRVLDLLPDRTAETLAAWLRAHPGVEIICRDRAGPYAEGARQGAPQAQQVADRWHLLHNLWEAVERFLRHRHRELRAAGLRLQREAVSAPLAPADPALPATDPPPLTRTAREQAATRDRRRARDQEIRSLVAQGLPIAAVARQVGVTRPTVRASLRAASAEADPTPQAAGILTPFAPYLWARWQQGCRQARILWREIRAQGYRGSYAHLRHALSGWRTHPARRGRAAQRGAGPEPVPNLPPLHACTPRRATALLLRDPADLSEREVAFLGHLRRECPEVERVQALAAGFQALVRAQDGPGLSGWVAAAEASGCAELCSFARGLRRDWAAVQAGITLPWNNGMSEGFVNKVKTCKRAMYGRAKLDLLRLRVLLAV
jgi:transposase